MALAAVKKSTTVRMLRTAFRVSEVVAPPVGAALATRLWMTLPPRSRDIPLPDGGTPFGVRSQGGTVRGRVYGAGPVVYLVHGWAGQAGQLGGFVGPLVERGHRVVAFDALSHGASDPGPSGPRSATGVELGKALDAVAAEFGPAAAVVAHSMGAVAGLLTLKYGWLSTDRLVLLAPMARYRTQFDVFQRFFGVGPRTRRRVDEAVTARVGVPVDEFDLAVLAGQVEPVPTLVVHDRQDRQTSYDESVDLVEGLPDARMVTTHGLGHQRLLRDPQVVETVAGFVAGGALVPELAGTA